MHFDIILALFKNNINYRKRKRWARDVPRGTLRGGRGWRAEWWKPEFRFRPKIRIRSEKSESKCRRKVTSRLRVANRRKRPTQIEAILFFFCCSSFRCDNFLQLTFQWMFHSMSILILFRVFQCETHFCWFFLSHFCSRTNDDDENLLCQKCLYAAQQQFMT